jgi:hypothetical protein
MPFVDLKTGRILMGCRDRETYVQQLSKLKPTKVLAKGKREDLPEPIVTSSVKLTKKDFFKGNLYLNYESTDTNQACQQPGLALDTAVRVLSQRNGFTAEYLIIVSA